MGEGQRNSGTYSGRKRRVWANDPHPSTKKRMLSTHDVPEMLETEGGEILTIPTRIDNELRQVILQCGQGIRDRATVVTVFKS